MTWRLWCDLPCADAETADFGGRETPIVSKTTLLRTADNPRQVQHDKVDDCFLFTKYYLLNLSFWKNNIIILTGYVLEEL
ncbi:MAG: hypothetical protein LBK53_02820 [Heliobacteriaceae bacterium]|nr:hypothetical protein [Heliobacteriaceae bacterium]